MRLVLMGVGTGGLAVLDIDANNERSVVQKREVVMTSVNMPYRFRYQRVMTSIMVLADILGTRVYSAVVREYVRTLKAEIWYRIVMLSHKTSSHHTGLSGLRF